MVTLAELITGLTADEMEEQLLASLQGVSPVIQSGAPGAAIVGTGQVSAQGPATAAAQVVLQIIASGQVGVGTFQYSLDGGNTWSSTQTIPSSGSYALSTIGVTLTFANGSYAPSGGSFQVGETYAFASTTPTFPITNWSEGSVPMTLLKMEAQELSDLSGTIAQIAAGGLVTSWLTPPLVNGVPTPPPSAWLDLVAQAVYNLSRNVAQSAQGYVTLTAVSGAGPYTIQAGQLSFQAVDGSVWYNLQGGTLLAGGTLQLLVQAQQPGSKYNAVTSYTGTPGLDNIVTMLTPLAGVSVSNPLLSNPPVSHSGSGSGTIAVSGSPSAEKLVSISITATGGAGVGTFEYSVNGASYSAPVTIPSGAYAIPGTGLSATFTGTFEIDDLYTFSSAWLQQNGTDSESNVSLATRCVNQWGTLAPAPPIGIYVNWAKSASNEVATAQIEVDQYTPGLVNILVAKADDQPVSASALAAVQSYIDARAPEGVSVSVQNVSSLAIAVGVGAGGGIYVHAAQLAAAQAAIASALAALEISIGIGGTVYYSVVLETIQAVAGVRNVEGLTINGGTADIVLVGAQVADFTPPGSGAYVSV